MPTYTDLDPTQLPIARPDASPFQWRIFMLKSLRRWIAENTERCPITTRLIDSIPYVTQAFFSVLEPGRSIPPHEGPNHGCLRYHLALRVPEVNPPIFRILEEEYVLKEGEDLLFDDTWEHEVQNASAEVRVILIVDILRPMPIHLHVANYLLMFVGGWGYARGIAERSHAHRA